MGHKWLVNAAQFSASFHVFEVKINAPHISWLNWPNKTGAETEKLSQTRLFILILSNNEPWLLTSRQLGTLSLSRARVQVISFRDSKTSRSGYGEGEDPGSWGSDIISDKFLQFSVPKMTTMTVVVTREMIHHSWATAIMASWWEFLSEILNIFVK